MTPPKWVKSNGWRKKEIEREREKIGVKTTLANATKVGARKPPGPIIGIQLWLHYYHQHSLFFTNEE